MATNEGFNGIVLRHKGLLFAVCRRYARRGLDEEDMLQEVLVVLWERREQLMSIPSTPQQASWMWRVARSTCVDLLRKEPPSYPVPENFDAPDEDTTLHRDLHELIAHLPEPDRSIVTLHLEGYEYKEIGRKLGMTKNNIGIRLMRIKERLKKEMIK